MAARVAIIGAGPSGLVAARYAALNGLNAVVFEKADTLGGVFRGPNSNIPGYAWSGMQTNTSFHTIRFSELMPVKSSAYPFFYQREVAEYLHNYADQFDLRSSIQFNQSVQNVSQVVTTATGGKQATKWLVQTAGSEKKSELFDFVVYAGGRYTRPYVPKYVNMSSYRGRIVHPSEFSTLNFEKTFGNKRVVVTGGSVSAFEVVPMIAQHASSVCHVLKNIPYVIPRWLPTPTSGMKPWDAVMLSRAHHPCYGHEIRMKSEEIFKQEHQLLGMLASEQQKHPYLNPLQTEQIVNPPRITVGEQYLNMLSNSNDSMARKLNFEVGQTVSHFVPDGVVLRNKRQIDCDVVVSCTGYQTDMNFFESKLLKSLEHDESCDPYLELILYKMTLRPEVPTVAFLGMHDLPLWLYLEMQARWTMGVFSGKLKLPNASLTSEYLQGERILRAHQPRKQFSHDDFVGFPDSIAAELGALPDINRLRQEDPELCDSLLNGPLIYEHYNLNGPDRAYARRVIDDFCKREFNFGKMQVRV